jgi:hypothetical protein
LERTTQVIASTAKGINLGFELLDHPRPRWMIPGGLAVSWGGSNVQIAATGKLLVASKRKRSFGPQEKEGV